MTYIHKDGVPAPQGKIRIGLLKHDDSAEEYIDKVERNLAEQGIKRG